MRATPGSWFAPLHPFSVLAVAALAGGGCLAIGWGDYKVAGVGAGGAGGAGVSSSEASSADVSSGSSSGAAGGTSSSSGQGGMPLAVWHSYDVRTTTQLGVSKMIVKDNVGKHDATVLPYQSKSLFDPGAETAFVGFLLGPHPDAYNNAQDVWY